MNTIEYTYVSLLADVARLSGFSEIRGSYEGLQWVLIEAPKLEKEVLRSIEDGRKPNLDLFPVWLRRLVVASVVEAKMLRLLRQLLLFCYKAEVPHDRQTTERALDGFFRTNAVVGNWGKSLATQCPVLLDRARKHCQSVLYMFHGDRIKPSHGPGAALTNKNSWEHLYTSIEAVYPFSDWFCLAQNAEHCARWDDMDHSQVIKCKLHAVPKDTRGPRLICVHPAEAIWIQQGVRRELERAIGSKRYCIGPWPRGQIRFNDQTVNGRIALIASRNRKFATIDMKEASDRISDKLVQYLFGEKYKYFGCCRASEVYYDMDARNRVRAPVHCYAPMGNATTFPVQSLVFWSICVATMERMGFRIPGSAFVFGDDIEVPTEVVERVVDSLESFGLLVNKEKSFWRGAFRESCGVDAFNGVDVTPVRWKTTLNAEHPTDLQALSDMAMRLRLAGYDDASGEAYRSLRCLMRKRHGKRIFFTNNRHHGGIVEYTDDHRLVRSCPSFRKNQRFQKTVTSVWRFKEVGPADSHGWNHVLESLATLSRAKPEPVSSGHLAIPSRDVSRRLRLHRGWIDTR